MLVFCNNIYKNNLKNRKYLNVLVGFIAGPDAGEGAERTQQNAPAAEPVTVAHGGAQPAADCAADGQANKNHKLHVVSVACRR